MGAHGCLGAVRLLPSSRVAPTVAVAGGFDLRS
jgi:hypothetical protein